MAKGFYYGFINDAVLYDKRVYRGTNHDRIKRGSTPKRQRLRHTFS